MGGAIAVRVAHDSQELPPEQAERKLPIIGLAVIDVVEGSAMDALSSMQMLLKSRPNKCALASVRVSVSVGVHLMHCFRLRGHLEICTGHDTGLHYYFCIFS